MTVGAIGSYHPGNKKIGLKGKVNGQEVEWILDTAADTSAVDEKLLRNCRTIGKAKVEMAEGAKFHRPVKCSNVEIQGLKLEANVIALSNPCYQAILGRDLLGKLPITVKWQEDVLFRGYEEMKEKMIKPAEMKIGEGIQLKGGTEVQKEEIRAVLIKNAEVFSQWTTELGLIRDEVCRIKMEGLPETRPPIPLSLADQEKAKKLIQEYEERGYIEKSRAPYAARTFFVTKKGTDEKRMVNDYRELNKISEKEEFPQPCCRQLLEQAAKNPWRCKLDARWAYHLIPVAVEDREKTSFHLPFGKWQWRVMPFGFKNGGAIFQRAITRILEPLIPEGAAVYMDDILVIGKSFEEMKSNLEKALKLLKEGGVKLHINKCEFIVKELEFLGFWLGKEGVEPTLEKREKIKEFRQPRTVKKLQSFLGFANYCRSFVKNFAEYEAILRQMPKKGFQWTKEEVDAFEHLKEAIANASKLYPFEPERVTDLKTDASQVALGALLLQKGDNGEDRLVGYASKVLTDVERRYTNTERELLAVEWAVTKKYVTMLEGHEFTAWTDCEALCGEARLKDPSKRVLRMLLKLQRFNFKFKHCKGAENGAADFLSRMHEDDEEVKILAMKQVNAGPRLYGRSVKEVKQILEGDARFMDEEEEDIISKFEVKRGFLRLKEDGRVIPEEEKRKGLIWTYHADELSHLDFKKTWNVLKERFFWPGMRKEIWQELLQCRECFKGNAPTTRYQKGVIKGVTTEKPKELLCMDFMGPLPKGRGGVQHCLLCVDHFSKMGFGKAVKAPTSENVVSFLEEIFGQYGKWEEVLSDQGKAFIGNKFVKFLEKKGVKQRLSTPNHPQSNGAAERFVRTIGQLLRKVCRKHGEWPDKLSKVIQSYNAGWNSATGATPFEAFLGKKYNMPSDKEWEVEPSGSPKSMEEVKKYKEKYRRSMEERNGSNIPFKEGECVFLKKKLRTDQCLRKERKFWNQRWGPFKIDGILRNGAYKLIDEKGNVVIGREWELFKNKRLTNVFFGCGRM